MSSFFRSASVRLPLLAFLVFVVLSFASRLVLLSIAFHDLGSAVSIGHAFATGLLMDVVSGLFAAVPWIIYGVFTPERFLKSRFGRVLTFSLMAVFASLLVFITISEVVFWDEFGVRFNFIAVDYLIWTQEVLGNINESYPMLSICMGIVLAGSGIAWLLSRMKVLIWAVQTPSSWVSRLATLVLGLALPSLAATWVTQSALLNFKNQYDAELAKNGCWSFFVAAKEMELNYAQWFRQLPLDQALALTKKSLVTPIETANSALPDDLQRNVRRHGEEKRWNVITICMESMSADLMTYGGSKRDVTPNLDRLAGESLFFDRLYATGTRTVRGMEALTLNLPPTPGQAIIYRPEGKDLVTTFTPFVNRGYDCAFFYGGDGTFDYMNRYFSTAGCRIMDVKAWQKAEVTFKTAWGACDEDLFNKTIAEADRNFGEGKSFHFFCMTTSNHRPYNFPEGKIDLKPNGKRPAAVKYSDWAIGKLISDASKRPWFKNTVFVIVADHCASSAGKVEIDVTKYHIPAIIYNPGLIPSQRVSHICSQIDLMPTLFGRMNWSYKTLGYGHDLITPEGMPFRERAFVSNYQKIALLEDESLAILKPKKESTVYQCNSLTGELTASTEVNPQILNDATSLYQSASWLFSSGRLKRKTHEAFSSTAALK